MFDKSKFKARTKKVTVETAKVVGSMSFVAVIYTAAFVGVAVGTVIGNEVCKKMGIVGFTKPA